MSTPSRPLVRWHGGKWQLAPWIISYFPKHKIYVEPFGGGGSVLLRKQCSYAEIYNDLDEEIVNLFKIVRDHGEELREKLRLTPFSRVEFNLAYKWADDPLERARRLVVRAFQGHGSNSHLKDAGRSGFRANSERSYTTPAHDWKNYPDCLAAIIERLRGVVIENRDAIEVMRQHDSPETLYYLDPPYLQGTRTDKSRRYQFDMTEKDHRELAKFLKTLKGMIVLSGYPSGLYDELYGDWRRVERRAYADGGLPRKEILWLRHCPRLSPGLALAELEIQGQACAGIHNYLRKFSIN